MGPGEEDFFMSVFVRIFCAHILPKITSTILHLNFQHFHSSIGRRASFVNAIVKLRLKQT